MANKKDSDFVAKATSQFDTWKLELKKYWPQINKNQETYEFYQHETNEEQTESNISFNTAFAIVESMVSRANNSSLSVVVNARGENGLSEFEMWVASILKQAIEDPDVASIHGTFRKVREKFFRNFLVQGNAVAKVEWCYQASIIDGKESLVADNPYTTVLPLKSVIFNPTKTLVDSDVYYIESYISYDDLKKKEKSKDGLGIYSNLAILKQLSTEQGKYIDSEDEFYFTDNRKVSRKIEPVHILERWEGTRYSVIADRSVVIRDDIDPFKIGRHNLLLAMNYVVGNRPYAYGEIDAIRPAVKAQDTVVNQKIDVINRYLRPGFLVSNATFDLDSMLDLIQNGGVMIGDPKSVGSIAQSLPLPPAQAFSQTQELQQAIERTARFSPYAAGLPSQETDKTAGTATGIVNLQRAAEPNFQVKIDALEDMFIQPLAQIYLKMIGNLMGESELRYGLLKGKNNKWVKITKDILQGRATLESLIAAGIITEEEADEFTYQPTTITDPATGENIVTVKEIPGSRKAYVFDVDWLVEAKLEAQAVAMKEQEVKNQMQFVSFLRSIGVPLNQTEIALSLGRKMGIEEVEKFIMPMPQAGQLPMMGGTAASPENTGVGLA